MASNLEQIASAVQALAPGPTYAFGLRALPQSIGLPRVVWVPSRDTFGAAILVGGYPRHIATCFTGLDAHIFAGTLEATEALRAALVVAAYTVAGTWVDLTAMTGEWQTQQALDNGWVSSGELYVLSMTFATPITESTADLTTTTILHVEPDASDAVQGDGVLECGEAS